MSATAGTINGYGNGRRGGLLIGEKQRRVKCGYC